MTPEEEEFEIIHRLRFTKEELEFPKKLEEAISQLGIIEIEDATEEQMIALSETMFGKK